MRLSKGFGAVVCAALLSSVPVLAGPRDPDPVRVRVVNTPTVKALPVAYKQPWHRALFIEVPAGSLSANASIAVPSGKRLVIEWVSGTTRVDAAELVRMTLASTASGEFASHEIAPSVYKRDFSSLSTPFAPDFIMAFSQSVKIYADPGTTVTIGAIRSENGEITPTGFGFSLSGYLVDCGGNPDCPIP
jgi:hypothetical protein